MNEHNPAAPTEDDQTALDALVAADPADAPEIAEGLASGLQRELDQTGATDPARRGPTDDQELRT